MRSMRNRFLSLALTLLLAATLTSVGCSSAIDAERAIAELEARERSIDLAGLLGAVKVRDSELIDLYLAAGVDPNSFENAGESPLMLAARMADGPAIERLLNGGATTDRLPDLLFVAASRGQLPALAILLDAGAAIETPDQLRRTPLQVAIDEARSEVALLLLDRGANPEGAERGDARRSRPLIEAASQGLDGVVRRLIEADANLEVIGGRPAATPLAAAARAGQLSTVQILLDAGADPAAELPGGLNAADVAARSGHEEIAALLR